MAVRWSVFSRVLLSAPSSSPLCITQPPGDVVSPQLQLILGLPGHRPVRRDGREKPQSRRRAWSTGSGHERKWIEGSGPARGAESADERAGRGERLCAGLLAWCLCATTIGTTGRACGCRSRDLMAEMVPGWNGPNGKGGKERRQVGRGCNVGATQMGGGGARLQALRGSLAPGHRHVYQSQYIYTVSPYRGKSDDFSLCLAGGHWRRLAKWTRGVVL